MYQSQRSSLYQRALDQLIASHCAYPCACSRKDIEDLWAASGQPKPRHGELIYPGTCRAGLAGREARVWRFFTSFLVQKSRGAGIKYAQDATFFIANDMHTVHWQDRRIKAQQQDVGREVGDFILKRAHGLWAYQLAVVVDDAAQGITHIVRGEDLVDNTARQILLQQALGYFTPQYLHTSLVLAPDGHKLSKQNGAQALALNSDAEVATALKSSAASLGLLAEGLTTTGDILRICIKQWRALYKA